MKLSNFLAGMDILRQHYREQDGYHLGAEHDQFYVYVTDTPLTQGEFERMRELGWFQPDLGDEEAAYDPREGWSAFV